MRGGSIQRNGIPRSGRVERPLTIATWQEVTVANPNSIRDLETRSYTIDKALSVTHLLLARNAFDDTIVCNPSASIVDVLSSVPSALNKWKTEGMPTT